MGQIRVDAQNVYQNTIKNETKEQNKVFGKKEDNMANQKKITNKDRDQQTAFLTQQLARCFNLIGAYIEFKGDDADFKKFLIDKEAEIKKKAEEENAAKNDNKSSDKSDS